jgi:hypothetical protein
MRQFSFPHQSGHHRTGLVRLEELTENELKELEASFEALRLKNAQNGTGSKLPGSDQTISPE